MNRREFIAGAAATVAAGPTLKDGVALTLCAHPLGAVASCDITDDSLVVLWAIGQDINGCPVVERIATK
jgi:hypothetical protein